MTRDEAERIYGPIKISRTANMTPCRGWDYSAVFEKLVDLDMPSWAEALGATREEALAELLEQAEDQRRTNMLNEAHDKLDRSIQDKGAMTREEYRGFLAMRKGVKVETVKFFREKGSV